MSFYAQYPASSAGGANPSIGLNGSTAPASSTEVGGIGDDGNLHAMHVDNNGNVYTTPASGSVQHVIVDSSALPTGASTSANQATEIASLASIDGKIVHVDTGNVTVVASALPTGAATSANQTTEITALNLFSGKTAAGFVPEKFDETVLTYVGATTNIDTVTYKLATVTVATLTLTYDGSDRLTGVVKS